MFYLIGPGCAGIQNITTLSEHQANLITTIIKESNSKGDFKTITVQSEKFDEYNQKAYEARLRIAEVQQKEDHFSTYSMNNHIYTNGINVHDYVMGGTLEYRGQLDEFEESRDSVTAMGLELTY